MTILKRASLRLAFALAAMILCNGARAQLNDFPNRIQIVVPASPGGLIDMSSRLIAQKLAGYWDVPVIVENKPGGNLLIGSGAVASGPADGSMILAGVEANIVVNPIFEPGTPYGLSDFTPLGQVWDTSLILVASKTVPATSFRELDRHVKANGRAMNFSSAGTHVELMAGALKDATGWNFVNVPYKGNVERMQSLLSGETQFTLISTGYAAPMVKAGKITGVFVTSAARSTDLPDVPTATEAGLQNFVITSWGGLFVSSKVQPAIRDKLRDGVRRALAEPDVQKLILSAGAETSVPDIAAFSRRIADDAERWRSVGKKYDIRTYR
ncbi:MAG TPA: tripartite tricarboxylate transporter substrate binding protein [Burkholderiaceae bacterium]|nr:tripartite tricarboxylate transporter substrate binding protein [Burkholderiaceae bacterium]